LRIAGGRVPCGGDLSVVTKDPTVAGDILDFGHTKASVRDRLSPLDRRSYGQIETRQYFASQRAIVGPQVRCANLVQ
jgi:hypothetical protein